MQQQGHPSTWLGGWSNHVHVPNSPRQVTDPSDAFLSASAGLAPDLRVSLADLRSLIIRALAPVVEYIRHDADVLDITFSKSHNVADPVCRISVGADGVSLSVGKTEAAPFDLRDLDNDPLRWLLQNTLQRKSASRVQGEQLGPVKRRRPAGIPRPASCANTPPGVVEIVHDLADDVDCPICEAPVFRWNLELHLKRHADPDVHRSVWTISGGGGPGTGKRR